MDGAFREIKSSEFLSNAALGETATLLLCVIALSAKQSRVFFGAA
jgi:hypothetical protein